MSIVLRPYQMASVESLRQGIREGHRSQMYYLPTGGGKGTIAAYFLQEAHRKGVSACLIVDRRVLVEQISATLDDYGVEHGVAMSGHYRYRPSEIIQVASAQTLEARGFFPGVKLAILDEAHVQRESITTFMAARPDIKFIGCSASPFSKGLGKSFSRVVSGGTTNKLIEDGFLVRPMFYAAKAPDMTGAKIVAGEWSDSEVETRGMQIIGDLVKEWIDKTTLHYGGPVKTIAFSATVNHGAEICRQFQEAGFNFQQISYRDTNNDRRRALIEEFKRPNSSIVGLVSVEALARGFDVPDVLCGIGARPLRKSFAAHIQMIGRVMRSSPGKDSALWLCHANNAIRFWNDTQDLFQNGVSKLDDSALEDGVRPEPDEQTYEKLKCSACGFVLPPNADACPACGRQRLRRSMIENVAGEMVLIGSMKVEATGKYAYLADRQEVWRQLAWMALKKKDGDIISAQKWAQAKFINIYGEPAKQRVEFTETSEPSDDLRRKIQSDNIRWAKSRQAA